MLFVCVLNAVTNENTHARQYLRMAEKFYRDLLTLISFPVFLYRFLGCNIIGGANRYCDTRFIERVGFAFCVVDFKNTFFYAVQYPIVPAISSSAILQELGKISCYQRGKIHAFASLVVQTHKYRAADRTIFYHFSVSTWKTNSVINTKRHCCQPLFY